MTFQVNIIIGKTKALTSVGL